MDLKRKSYQDISTSPAMTVGETDGFPQTRTIVILNAHSGTGSSENEQNRLPELLKRHGIEAQVTAVEGSQLQETAKRAVSDGYGLIVAGGGDGTVSAIAAAVAGTDAVLGVLPLGTLNHFAKDLQIPLDLEEAIRNLRTGTAEPVDVGAVNGSIFVNNSSLGLYPRLVYLRNAQQKRGRGKWIGFLRAALVTFRRFPFLRVRLQASGHSMERKTPFVFIGNNEYAFEGLRIGSRQRLNGGHLCVSVAQRVGRWGVLRLVIRALLGRLTEDRDFIMLSTKELWVGTRKKLLPVSLDGEVMLMQAPLQYETRPGALRVIVPPRQS